MRVLLVSVDHCNSLWAHGVNCNGTRRVGTDKETNLDNWVQLHDRVVTNLSLDFIGTLYT